jgi:hypothetical protein
MKKVKKSGFFPPCLVSRPTSFCEKTIAATKFLYFPTFSVDFKGKRDKGAKERHKVTSKNGGERLRRSCSSLWQRKKAQQEEKPTC